MAFSQYLTKVNEFLDVGVEFFVVCPSPTVSAAQAVYGEDAWHALTAHIESCGEGWIKLPLSGLGYSPS